MSLNETCPVCGGSAYLTFGFLGWYVVCRKCRVETGPWSGATNAMREWPQEEAIKAWNGQKGSVNVIIEPMAEGSDDE